MGWCVFDEFGDTVPEESLRIVDELKIVFFGGVGDPVLDNTLGKQYSEMLPERRALLVIRKRLGLLLNFRPMLYRRKWAHLSPLRPELIPGDGTEQIILRFLLEDSYFGTADLRHLIPEGICEQVGIKLLDEVTGDEEIVTELAYYTREMVEKYFRAAFLFARQKGLPVTCVHKANILPRYMFWKKIAARIGREEFPDVELRFQLVDSAAALLFNPALLSGVVACGNEQGDILSDGGVAALGGMGMMYSSAINPDTGAAMFESGAGTAPTLAGQDRVNPSGRILAAAMMLWHVGAIKGARAIETAVNRFFLDGWRTEDIALGADSTKILGTAAMGEKILGYL